jgi:putative transposase
VIEALSDLFILRGVPAFLRSDNGLEFVAQAFGACITSICTRTAYAGPGSPWENRWCEFLNARSRDELLNSEILYSPREVQILI